MNQVTHELDIPADPPTVYRCFTEPEPLGEWMAATDVVADARVGGELGWTHENGHRVSGRFVELVPWRRVRFDYGWEDGWLGVPAGSTTVEVHLTPLGAGDVTRLRLVHRGLGPDAARRHREGWAHFLGRLAEAPRREGVR